MHRKYWLGVLLVAFISRLAVLASGSVSFDSDEAIVGLMARHILHGQPIPIFFYGQPYMGSLDPLLVSFMFRLTGETVIGIRLVQMALYLLTVATTMILALRVSQNEKIAAVAGLLVALPAPLVTLYTTMSLGGYGETLLIGNLLLLAGHEILTARPGSWIAWVMLGALTGLGWWTNNLIAMYILPVGLLLLLRRILPPARIVGAVGAFLLFSAPWWVYNLSHSWESVQFLTGGFAPRIGPIDRLAGLLVFGLPAVAGVRYPWAPDFWAGFGSIPILIVYVVLLVRAVRVPRSALLWTMVAGVLAIFVLSSFGIDATGRYLLPLAVPMAILVTLRGPFPVIGMLVLVNVLGTVLAMQRGTITPQFDPATDFTNAYDQQVIDLLKGHEATVGYGTYWVSYRLAFLSHEEITLSPQLPYKADLSFTPSERYAPYTERAAQAARPVLVTANLPALDSAIAKRLAQAGIGYSKQVIGPYTIFYGLSSHADPAALGLQTLVTSPTR